MKRRFLALMLILIVVVSLVALVVSRLTSEKTIERLLTESAEQRFSIIVLGFNSTSSGVDLYAYLNFEHELLTVTSGGFPVLQYGTAKIDPEAPHLRRYERVSSVYRFVLLVDFEAELARFYTPVRTTIYTIGAVYAVLFAVFGWIFVTLVADPVSRMADTIEKITSRNLRARLPVPGRKDELRKLVLTFNAMLDDIAQTYERQVQLVEDLTHDIATPVQIMEGYRQLIERHGADEKLLREFMDATKIQLARLRDMAGLLHDSLAAERVRRVERADASAITERNLRYYRELHPDFEFDGVIAAGVDLGIAPEDLERIEHILIDNAVKYGRDGGRIEIVLESDSFRVRDFGMGIAIEEQRAIFERYHRSPEAGTRGPGSGIGLAILSKFSEEYGFRIELESAPGKGTTFTLHFRDPSPAR